MSCKVTCSSAYELLSIEHEIFYTDGKNGIKTIELKKESRLLTLILVHKTLSKSIISIVLKYKYPFENFKNLRDSGYPKSKNEFL